jgi:O-antigen/teichoic acid export membrane protein
MLKMIKQKLSSGMGRDVVWTFSIQILIMLCSFAINKLLANRLSIDDFGQYNVIKRSVQVLSFVMLAGVGIALPRYIPLYRNSDPPRRIAPLLGASLIYIIGITIVVFAGSMIFSGQMQVLVIGEGGNMNLLLIALAYAFALAIAQVVYAYYRGVGDFRWYNGTQLATQLSIIVPLVALPILTVSNVFESWLTITTLLVAYLIGREIWLKRDRIFPLSTAESPISSHLKTIVRYSSGRLVADFFQYSLTAFPLIYISNAKGLQATAYMSVGITFVSMIVPLYIFMGIILLPYVSECLAKNELAKANRFISHLLIIYIASSLLMIAVLYLFTEPLTTLLFAQNYVVTADLTRIMILAILPQAVYMLYRSTIDAVSVTPYNAIILGGCLLAMVAGFKLSTDLSQFAWVYFAVSALQGFLSLLTWMLLKKK